MKLDISYTDGKAMVRYIDQWKYCDNCGFCHADDFARCLRLAAQRKYHLKEK